MADKKATPPPNSSNPSPGWNPDKFVGMVQDALETYEKEHPHWRIEVLVSFIKWGLTSLKHYIEECDAEVSWRSPFIDLNYPVDWDWKRKPLSQDADEAHCGMIFGTFTPENTATKESTAKVLSEIMVGRLNTLALGDFTNGAWFEIQNNYFTPFLPLELSKELNAVKGKRARREFFEEIVRPFSLGAASIDYLGMQFRDGTRVPKRVARRLERIHELMDIQSIEFTGTINGRAVKMSVIFQIHPLVADHDQRKAYHTITCGLFIEPQIIEGELVESTPADWPASERETLWRELLNQVDSLKNQLIPQSEVQSSKILIINAELEIPILSATQMNAAKAKVVELLSQAPGLLRRVSVEATDSQEATKSKTLGVPQGTSEDLTGEIPVVESSTELRSTRFVNVDSKRKLLVFLCHATEDKKAVRVLHERLTAAGFQPWLDEVNLLPGQDWDKVITATVEQADAIVVCLSSASVPKRGYFQKEIRIALEAALRRPEGEIFIVPVLLSECPIPPSLSRWHAVRLDEKDGFQKLERALAGRGLP